MNGGDRTDEFRHLLRRWEAPPERRLPAAPPGEAALGAARLVDAAGRLNRRILRAGAACRQYGERLDALTSVWDGCKAQRRPFRDLSPVSAEPGADEPLDYGSLMREVTALSRGLDDFEADVNRRKFAAADGREHWRAVVAVLRGRLAAIAQGLTATEARRVKAEDEIDKIFNRLGALSISEVPMLRFPRDDKVLNADRPEMLLPDVLRPFLAAAWRKVALAATSADSKAPEATVPADGWADDDLPVGGDAVAAAAEGSQSERALPFARIAAHHEDGGDEAAIAAQLATEHALLLQTQTRRNRLEMNVRQVQQRMAELSTINSFFALKVREQDELCTSIFEQVEASAGLVASAKKQLIIAKNRGNSYRNWLISFYICGGVFILMVDFLTSRHRY